MRSVGLQFPTNNILVADRHLDLSNNGVYRYRGGDPTNILDNWLLVGGELNGHPDTSLWALRQAGALWFNIPLACWFGWSGTQIVSFCAVADPYAELKASPHDFGNINPSVTSAPLVLPGNATLFFDTSTNLPGTELDFVFTNPADTVTTSGHTAGTFEEIRDVTTNQTLAITNNSGIPTFTVTIAIDAAGTCVIATATIIGLF